MSTAASNARRELWPWIGHNAWWLDFTVNAALIGTIFWESPIWALPTIIALMVFFAVAQRRHDRSLCERCIANMPLDPQAEIIKRDRWLRISHWGDGATRTKALLVTVAFLIAYITITWFAPKAIGAIVVVLVIGIAGPLFTISTQVHKRLQPWCPYCRRNGGGGDHQFDPTPTPERSKELT